METSEAASKTKLSVGWGWYFLIGLMIKFAADMRYSYALSIAIELVLFCGIMYFYFRKRKDIYQKEHHLPEFKLSRASLRAGFYSLLLFLGSLFVTAIADRFVYRILQ
jgi:hypothetical protein